jgi:hypothetical protein
MQPGRQPVDMGPEPDALHGATNNDLCPFENHRLGRSESCRTHMMVRLTPASGVLSAKSSTCRELPSPFGQRGADFGRVRVGADFGRVRVFNSLLTKRFQSQCRLPQGIVFRARVADLARRNSVTCRRKIVSPRRLASAGCAADGIAPSMPSDRALAPCAPGWFFNGVRALRFGVLVAGILERLTFAHGGMDVIPRVAALYAWRITLR